MPSPRPAALLLASALAALTACPDADAATVIRNETSTAVLHCQGALPAYEGSLRQRPKALQNEGSTTAFVSCAFQGRGGDRSLEPKARSLTLYLVNNGPETRTVSCTATEGSGDGNFASRDQLVPVGSTQNAIAFTATQINPDFGDVWRVPVVSCALPPGTGISTIWYGFIEDIGA